MMSPSDKSGVIGKDISWKELATYNRSGLLRVVEFERLAKIEGDKVKALSLTMPYGVATVECLDSKWQFVLYITHKLDFIRLCNAYDLCSNPEEKEKVFLERNAHLRAVMKRQWEKGQEIHPLFWETREVEVLVGDFKRTLARGMRGYWGRKLFGRWLPRLYVWVCPKGYLERVVSDDRMGLSGEAHLEATRPLAEWKPRV
jgi:hypothetical protein